MSEPGVVRDPVFRIPIGHAHRIVTRAKAVIALDVAARPSLVDFLKKEASAGGCGLAKLAPEKLQKYIDKLEDAGLESPEFWYDDDDFLATFRAEVMGTGDGGGDKQGAGGGGQGLPPKPPDTPDGGGGAGGGGGGGGGGDGGKPPLVKQLSTAPSYCTHGGAGHKAAALAPRHKEAWETVGWLLW